MLRRAVQALLAAAIALHVACEPGPDAPPAEPASPSARTAPAADATARPLPATAIAAGGSRHFATFAHACAVVAGGLQCWGAGESAQLGDGLLARRSPRPIRAFASHSGVTAISAGGVHSCALVGGEALCWGGNFHGQVGVPRPYIVADPTPVAGLPGPVSGIAAGIDHSCAAAAGGVWCWGSNAQGQAGRPPCEPGSRFDHCSVEPAPVAGLAGAAGALALGRFHTCALVDAGVQCWGAAGRGQLGDGTTRGRPEPAPVSGLPGAVTALAAGFEHTCAVAAGRVYCWGANGEGQLGDGSRTQRDAAVATRLRESPVTALAAGGDHTCAVAGGRVFCWGGDPLGAAAAVDPLLPRAVAGLPPGVSALAVGVDDACALAADGGVWCWGDNDFGQLGSADAPLDHATPVRVAAWDDGRLRDRNGDGRIVVACLGDSNTQPRPELPRTWCERLADLAPAEFAFVNRGEGGASAVANGSLISAAEHLDYTLENDAVDAVILAYGTNDLKIAHADPTEVAYAYAHLRERAQSAGVDAFAATTPPVRSGIGGVDAKIAELNALLTDFFPASRIIDFGAGIASADFVDEVHFGESGQAKRARAAWATLAAAAGLPVAP